MSMDLVSVRKIVRAQSFQACSHVIRYVEPPDCLVISFVSSSKLVASEIVAVRCGAALRAERQGHSHIMAVYVEHLLPKLKAQAPYVPH